MSKSRALIRNNYFCCVNLILPTLAIFCYFSLCTTLCLQWEPEVIAIALMYLAGKLSKFEITDWSGRQPRHIRWWDMFVEDISLEILEGILSLIGRYIFFSSY